MALLTKSNQGFSLVEIVASISLMMVILVGSLSANSLASNSVGLNKVRSQANLLAKEGMEALYIVRAVNFASLHVGDFHPVLNSGIWALSPGEETIGQFKRTITISSVMRSLICSNPVCDIIPAGGRFDPLTYKVTVKVSWKESGDDKSYLLNSLVTYWR